MDHPIRVLYFRVTQLIISVSSISRLNLDILLSAWSNLRLSSCLFNSATFPYRVCKPTLSKMGNSRPIFLYFHLFNTIDDRLDYWRPDSNLGSQVLVATVLPTVPQPLPTHTSGILCREWFGLPGQPVKWAKPSSFFIDNRGGFFFFWRRRVKNDWRIFHRLITRQRMIKSWTKTCLQIIS